MPVVGHIAAAAARQSAARRRQGRTQCGSTPSSFSPAEVPVTKKPSIIERLREYDFDHLCETTSNASVDSNVSVLSKFRQHVHEAGGLLKKKQQFVVEKMQKGFQFAQNVAVGQKTVPSIHDAPTPQATHKDEIQARKAPLPAIAATTTDRPPTNTSTTAINPTTTTAPITDTKNTTWLDSLQQMGFRHSDIQIAMTSLGSKAKQIDDVVQVLVEMEAKSMEAMSTGGSSSSDSFPVLVKKCRGDSLGIVVDVSGSALRIDKISVGLVAQWNSTNKIVQVKAGDFIVEVNGVRGNARALLDLLTHADDIRMSIKAASAVQTIMEEPADHVVAAAAVPEHVSADVISDTNSLSDTASVIELEAGAADPQVPIADFAAQIVESAFVEAARVVEAEFAQERLAAERLAAKQDQAKLSKHVHDERHYASPMKGGA